MGVLYNNASDFPQKECIREHPKPQYFLRASISAARRGISLWAVSYTHLDVYKRQVYIWITDEQWKLVKNVQTLASPVS